MSFDFGLMVMEACEEFQQGIALVALSIRRTARRQHGNRLERERSPVGRQVRRRRNSSEKL